MSRAALLSLLLLTAAGCIMFEDGSGDAYTSAAPGGEEGVWRRRRRRRATWLLVRIWSVPTPDDGADEVVQAFPVESLKEDVAIAGLRVAPDVARDGPHEALLLRGGQSGFVAISRGEAVPSFEVVGRPLGGGDSRADVGFEIEGELLPEGKIRLEMAPLFRRFSDLDADEIRAGALSFVAEVEDGETLLLTSPESAPDSAIRALFAGPGGRRRRLWIQVKTL